MTNQMIIESPTNFNKNFKFIYIKLFIKEARNPMLVSLALQKYQRGFPY